MPYDKSIVYKGMHLTGGDFPALHVAGRAPARPSPSPVRYGATPPLPDLQPLSDRLDDLARRIEALRRR